MTPLTPVALGEPPTPEELGAVRLTTYNVWFDEFRRADRYRALLEVLRPWRPHLMAFQEVTARFVEVLVDTPWLGEYWVSSLDPRQLGVLLVARVPAERVWLEPLPTRLGRRLLVADLAFGLRLGTAHFESLEFGRTARHQQLAAAFGLLDEAAAAVLTGDFNFGDGKEEESSLHPAYRDLWRERFPDDPGYTRDTLTNAMGRPRGTAKRERLDRILLRAPGWRATRVERLGTAQFEPGVFPSDHFGLLADLERLEGADRVDPKLAGNAR